MVRTLGNPPIHCEEIGSLPILQLLAFRELYLNDFEAFRIVNHARLKAKLLLETADLEINEVIMQLGEDCNNNNYLSEEYEIMEAYAAIFPEARNVLKWDNEKMEDVSGDFIVVIGDDWPSSVSNNLSKYGFPDLSSFAEHMEKITSFNKLFLFLQKNLYSVKATFHGHYFDAEGEKSAEFYDGQMKCFEEVIHNLRKLSEDGVIVVVQTPLEVEDRYQALSAANVRAVCAINNCVHACYNIYGDSGDITDQNEIDERLNKAIIKVISCPTSDLLQMADALSSVYHRFGSQESLYHEFVEQKVSAKRLLTQKLTRHRPILGDSIDFGALSFISVRGLISCKNTFKPIKVPRKMIMLVKKEEDSFMPGSDDEDDLENKKSLQPYLTSTPIQPYNRSDLPPIFYHNDKDLRPLHDQYNTVEIKQEWNCETPLRAPHKNYDHENLYEAHDVKPSFHPPKRSYPANQGNDYYDPYRDRPTSSSNENVAHFGQYNTWRNPQQDYQRSSHQNHYEDQRREYQRPYRYENDYHYNNKRARYDNRYPPNGYNNNRGLGNNFGHAISFAESHAQYRNLIQCVQSNQQYPGQSNQQNLIQLGQPNYRERVQSRHRELIQLSQVNQHNLVQTGECNYWELLQLGQSNQQYPGQRNQQNLIQISQSNYRELVQPGQSKDPFDPPTEPAPTLDHVESLHWNRHADEAPPNSGHADHGHKQEKEDLDVSILKWKGQ